MNASLDFSVLKQKDTWKAFVIGMILFCIIGFASLSLFGYSASIYGVSDEIEPVPDFIAPTMNRTGIDDVVTLENGSLQLYDLRGKVVILDFMAIDCGNCHYVQEHINQNIESWQSLEGEYPIVVVSIASWYDYESFEQINSTFGDSDSDKYMYWPLVNGGKDVILLENGERGDIVEYYSAQLIPLVLVIDHEGYVISKENTGTPLDGWSSFDNAVEKANTGNAEELRFGIEKTDRSTQGVFMIGLFLGVLVYFSPCAFPVLPSYITYTLNLGMREDELRLNGKLIGKIPGPLAMGSYAALGQLTFFSVIGIIIFGLSEIFNLSGFLHDIAIGIAVLLVILGGLMLLGWTSHILSGVQNIIDKYQTKEDNDELFTPRRNMYLWGIGYSAASVDCTAAAVFPFIGWLAVVGKTEFLFGLLGLMISVSFLMIAVTALVSMGRQAMIGHLRSSTGLIKAIGSWMMMFAGLGLLIYLTQPEIVSSIIA
jgi:cytochrome c biogenesis protein CcdA/thiol-disulfide isomerase/thioredoxin